MLELLAVDGRLLEDLYLRRLLQDLGFRYEQAEILEGVAQVHSSLSLEGVVNGAAAFVGLHSVPPSVLGGFHHLGVVVPHSLRVGGGLPLRLDLDRHESAAGGGGGGGGGGGLLALDEGGGRRTTLPVPHRLLYGHLQLSLHVH